MLIGWGGHVVTLWDWPQSATQSRMPSIKPRNMFWRHEIRGGTDRIYDILPPITVDGSLRCIVPTNNFGVYLVSIPHDDDGVTPASITCRQMYSGKLLRAKEACSPFGYRHGLAYERLLGWGKISYRPDVPSSLLNSHFAFHPPNYPGGPPDPPLRVVILDQVSDRVVASSLSTFSIFDLTPRRYS